MGFTFAVAVAIAVANALTLHRFAESAEECEEDLCDTDQQAS